MRISDWSSDVCSSVLAVFLPGGHGAMWDFPGNRLLADLIGRAFLQGLVIGAVCPGPTGPLAATKGDDSPLVPGRRESGNTAGRVRGGKYAELTMVGGILKNEIIRQRK